MKYWLLYGFFLLNCLPVWCQQDSHAFYKAIQAFKTQDSISFPAKGQALFIGSSSFTYWKNIDSFFPGHKILNRGFGGSTLLDVTFYRNDVIFRYDPKQIVIYCGENDFAYSDTVQVETVVSRFIELFRYIRQRYPRVPIAFISIKPSPSRRHLFPKFIAANEAIRSFLAAQKRSRYIDVYHKMLTAEGQPMPAIFKADSLHMNNNGYVIWQQQIQPVLK